MLTNCYSQKEYFDDVPFEFEQSLIYLKDNIQKRINDPKYIVGDLNHLNDEEKINLISRINNDLENIENSRGVSKEKEFKYWKEVLGNEFPDYEG